MERKNSEYFHCRAVLALDVIRKSGFSAEEGLTRNFSEKNTLFLLRIDITNPAYDIYFSLKSIIILHNHPIIFKHRKGCEEMNLSSEQRHKLDMANERLFVKCREIRKRKTVELGETAAPRPADYVEDDPLCGKVDTDWVREIEPENSALDAVIKEILAGAPPRDTSSYVKLGDDNLWVWGGPTPYWGGTMADDTLVKGADYFNAKNVVYVYGPTSEKMLALHAKYKRMLCQVNSNCRTPGAQGGASDEENAEYLSRMSLRFPNIAGAMCDDVTLDYLKIILPERFAARYHALKKHNPNLKMYGVVYVHELDQKDFTYILPYMDVVNLWFWHKEEILDFDEKIELCRQKFPGKPIIQGIFLHEYGRSDAGNLPELLVYQLDKAREYITKGVMEGVIILGDREIKKWPTSAEAVKNYLMNQ